MLSNGGPDTGSFQPLEDGDPQVVGGYRLVARLGAGGMGRVYLSHTPGGRAVAVKVIRPELAENPEFRKRFRAEVASASRVHGLYTAPVVDSDTEGSMPWCATAYVPGPSLADAVSDHGPLPVDTVLRLIAGVAEALQAVHREGIVHRDLKPSNVLLAADGPRVIDFGVARAADTTSVTQSGTALGTIAYMAPEQVLGGEALASADVFALGQTAVFAATGVAAFGEGDPHAVLYRVVHEEPDLGRVPMEIRELVARCLRKPAAERPSVEEVIRSVSAIQTNRGDEARFTSGAWLPGELAAGIAARAEGADQARAGAAPGAHASGGFGPVGSGGFGSAGSGGFGSAGSDGFGSAGSSAAGSAGSGGFGPAGSSAAGSAGSGGFGPAGSGGYGYPTPYSPTSPSHAAAPGPFVMAPGATPGPYGATPPWSQSQPQSQSPAAAQTSSVDSGGRGRKGRGWVLSAAAVVLVGGGATAALLLVPGDGDKSDPQAQEVAASQSATAEKASPSTSGSPSARVSEKPKPVKSALPASPSGPPTPTRTATSAPPTAASSEPAAPTTPVPVTYSGIQLTKSHDLYLADTPVRSKADTGTSDEDLTYAVYSSGAVLAPGTDSGSSLALLPAGRQGSLDACKAATGYKSYIWVKDLTVGQQMCVISGTGHVGLVTYQGSSGTTYATLDVKVWRNAAQ
ncbi:protein kinase [Streptomyces sp. NBC_00243]|uniref:serine/threonine-protein kinase n=1 Tax=Streptomyces sp. NBC_00243 TaxID=2975688 RepID=UPI002DDBE262|nr:protein kinase [Streptomyces sp. NBC_00243]WRZ24498.1 protein kinase [Streptomyces sp. NBC_00243]